MTSFANARSARTYQVSPVVKLACPHDREHYSDSFHRAREG